MAHSIELGIAKVNKYASRESGDTAEVVERPGGGFSVVVVDGQGSGAAAKALSLMMTAKAVTLLKEGVRDGAVARAVHDTLIAYRGGKVSASIDIMSADLKHSNLVLTRNGTSPVIVHSQNQTQVIPPGEGPIGIYPFMRPSVLRFPIESGLQVWVVTDGVVVAGRKWGETPIDLANETSRFMESKLDAKVQAQRLLELAMEADRGRPSDDMCVATLRVLPCESETEIRSLHMVVPGA
jgi:serine phosphatase RsbU (regulator of sigma subunit)